MTVAEFKELKPELAHLEGNALWNAMEDYVLEHGTPAEEPSFPTDCPLTSYSFIILDVSEG